MRKLGCSLLSALALVCTLLAAGLPARQERTAQSHEEGAYGSKFFEELRTIFGRFRNTDLQRVFEQAEPVQCSELVGRQGEWRTVAFFNENRELGDWCRESLEEVRSDLAVYTFKGTCSGEQGSIEVGTEFPTDESIQAYNRREIDLDRIDVMVNDPVDARMDPKTGALTFDLPYLFRTGRKGTMDIYSLMAPDRNSAYATDVTNRWECRAVSSKDVTYRFLICRSSTSPLRPARRNENYVSAFGAAAYFVLSDGTEAQSSVNLSFGNETQASDKAPETAPAEPTVPRPTLKRPAKTNPSPPPGP